MKKIDRLLKRLRESQDAGKAYIQIAVIGEIGCSGKWRVYYQYLKAPGEPAPDLDYSDDYSTREEALSAIDEATSHNPIDCKGNRKQCCILDVADISIWENA